MKLIQPNAHPTSNPAIAKSVQDYLDIRNDCTLFLEMESSHELMIAWVLGELSRAGQEGVAISTLFQQVGQVFNCDDQARNLLWESLISKYDVLLKEQGREVVLRNSPLKKLALEDVSSLGFGAKNIMLKKPPASNLLHNLSAVEQEKVDRVELQQESSHTGLERYPDVPVQSSQPQKPSPAPQETDYISVKTSPIAADEEPQDSSISIRHTPENSNQAASDVNQPTASNFLELEIATARKSENLIFTSPARLTNLIEHTRTATTKDGAETPAPSPSKGRDIDPISSTRSKKTYNNVGLFKKADYTSYEELQFDAGEQGVYDNPKGATPHFNGAKRGGRKDARIIVFRMARLKDPEWLERQKGTWFDYVAEAIASHTIDVQDNTKKPKRKRRARKTMLPENFDSDSKPQKSTKNATNISFVTENESLAVSSQKTLSRIGEQGLGKQASSLKADISTTVRNLTLAERRSSTELHIAAAHSSESGGSTKRTRRAGIGSKAPALQTEPQVATHPTLQHLATFQQNNLQHHLSEIEANGSVWDVSSDLNHEKKLKQNILSDGSAQQRQPSLLTSSFYENFQQSQSSAYRSPYVPVSDSKTSAFETPASRNQATYTHMNPHASPFKPSGKIQVAQQHQPLSAEIPAIGSSVPSAQNKAHIQIGNPFVSAEYSNSPYSRAGKTSNETNQNVSPQILKSSSSKFTESVLVPPDGRTASRTMWKQTTPKLDSGIPSALNDVLIDKITSMPEPELGDLPCQEQARTPVLSVLADTTVSQASNNGKRRLTQGAQHLEDGTWTNESPAKKPKLDPKQRTRAANNDEHNQLVHLRCRFQGNDGTLLLSADKRLIEFYSLDQHPPEVAQFALATSRITQNPITSIAGSNPMELRIKAMNLVDEIVSYAFEFTPTETVSQAANSMRAKIVTAIIASKFRGGSTTYERPVEIKAEILKPFACKTCEKRFKNEGGLLYHVTKSNTTCNPNFDTSVEPRKRGGRNHKRKKQMRTPERRKSKVSKSGMSPQPELHSSDRDEKIKTTGSDNDSVSTNSSEDSIYRWARRNATSGVELQCKVTTANTPTRSNTSNKRIYKALPREAMILKEILEEASLKPTEMLSQQGQLIDISSHKNTSQVSFRGKLGRETYENLIMDLVRANNNIFPGDKSLWFACVGIWLSETVGIVPDVRSESAPESKIVSQVLDELVESKKLEQHDITLLSSRRRVTRKIITMPGMDLNSTGVVMLKESMEKSFPEYHIPSQFSPAPTILDKLQRIASQALARSNGPEESGGDDTQSSKQSSVQPAFSDVDFNFDVESNDDHDSPTGFETESADESEEFSEKEEAQNFREKRYRSRSAIWKSNISRGLQKYYQSTRGPGYKARGPRKSQKINRKHLTQEEKDRRAQNARLRQVSWQSAPCFIPDPKSGAWNQDPIKTSVFSNYPKVYRVRRQPEPITYMQAEDGSWSIRPFGHGVTPIYSRPARMTAGNPHSSRYLDKKHNSFRPIIFPSTEKQKHYPLSLSKNKHARLDMSNATEANRGSRKRKSSHDGDGDGDGDGNHDQSNWEAVSARSKRLAKRQRLQYQSENQSKEVVESQEEQVSHITAPPSEIEILSFYEPKKLNSATKQNPGLETLPPSYGLSNLYRSPQELDFPTNYSRIEILVPKIVDEDFSPAVGSWTLTAVACHNRSVLDLRWDEQTIFTLETLPYHELDFVLGIEEPSPDFRPPQPRRQSKRQPQRKRVARTQENKYNFARPLTHFDMDFVGVGNSPEEVAKSMGIQITEPSQKMQQRKRIVAEGMSLDIEKRFIVAIVIIRTLTGGIDLCIDWVIVSTLFKNYSLFYLRALWKRLLVRHKHTIDRLAIDFQEAFIVAYENGEILAIDYEHLADYNWNTLLDWAFDHIDTGFEQKEIVLPHSRAEFTSRFELNEMRNSNNLMDEWFSTGATYTRIDNACFNARAMPIENERKPKLVCGIDNLTIARSWLRAMALTPDVNYSLEIAGAKLKKFGTKTVEAALGQLTQSKVLTNRAKHRATPGRSFEATDFFYKPLRREVKPRCMRDATVFKRFLDSEFRNKKEYVRVDYMAWEGDVMVITSMQAYGRITLEAVGVPNNKWGLTDGGYETKKIPRERLRFEMDIYPTSSYVYDEDNTVVKNALDAGPPKGIQGAIPVWYSITNTVIENLWKEVVSAFAQVLAFRAGIDVTELKRIFTPTLEEWEIRILLEWGENMGLWRRLSKDVDGWIAEEWWWAYVMGLFAYDRFEMNDTKAGRSEPKNPFTMKGRLQG